MKKKALLACLLAAAMILSGCTDKKANSTSASSSASSATVTTAATSVSDTTAPAESSDTMQTDEPFRGEYDADEDGKVTDGSDHSDDGSMTPGQTDDDSAVTTRTSVTDEAFASSYMANELSGRKTGWGLGKERDSKNRPLDAVNAEEKYKDLSARFIASDGHICLTFDEGYENGYTEKILDILKEKDVKAVFFVTGDYCVKNPELIRRMIDEGHTVGNHTWGHPSMPDITQKQVWDEVTRLHKYVSDEFGYEMTLFRFPMGEFSERCLDDLKGLGYTSVFWSFAYKDWDTNAQPDPAEALARIKDSAHSGIYLLHAVSPTNAQILPEVIDYLREQGFSVGSEL